MGDCICHSGRHERGETLSSAELPRVTTLSAGQIATLFQGGHQTLASVSPGAGVALPAGGLFPAAQLPSGASAQIHTTPDGGIFTSSGFAVGANGDVVLTGSVGPLPYEMHLHIAVDDTVVTVELTVTKPLPMGPFTWKFNLGGVTRDAAGNIISATSLTLDPTTNLAPPGMVAPALNWWCVLRCGGLGILGILVKCLPSLTGGVAGYVACVTAAAGEGAAGIATCIATQCA